MPGVGKLLKQAQKMQKKMEALQADLAQREIEVSSGGGAVNVRITLQPEIKAITLDPEILEEDKDFIEETLVTAVQEALAKAKELNEEEMSKVTVGFGFPGMM